jgi:hypothetical protein
MEFLNGLPSAISNPLHGPAKPFSKIIFQFCRAQVKSFRHQLKTIYFSNASHKERNLGYHAVLRKRGLGSPIALTGGEYDIPNPVLSNSATA